MTTSSHLQQNSHIPAYPLRQNRHYQICRLLCNWESGFGFRLDIGIGVHNF